MKKILYFISDHGLGHLARSIAIIREFKKEAEFFIRNSNINFIEQSLPNVKTFVGKTDQGPIIEDNGISIDWKQSKFAIENWYSEINSNIKNEEEIISKIKPDLIISDISPLPLAVSKKLSIPSMVISNFTWLDIFSQLSDFDLNPLRAIYENTSLCLQLPLSTPMSVFKNKERVGFVSKKPTLTKEVVRKNLGIDESKFLIFVNLPDYFNITISTEKNIQVISTGAHVNIDNLIIIKPWIEGQNLVASSDLVVCKCGYNMISECLTNNIPFHFLFDENHPEQTAMYQKLNSLGINSSINDWKSGKIRFDLYPNTLKFKPINNDNSKIKELILEFIK